MANNFLLDPEKQKELEQYFNGSQTPEQSDPRYDPSSLGEFLPSMPDLSGVQNFLSGFNTQSLPANEEMKTNNDGYFGSKLPASPEEVQPQMAPSPISAKPIIPTVHQPLAPETAVPQESPMQKILNEYQKLYSTDQLQSDADLMNQALDKKRDLSMLDMFLKGGAQMAGGIAQTKPAEMVQTAGLADIDIEKAKQKTNLTDRQRQALEAQMKILDVKEMNDPTSMTSKVYRRTLQDLSPAIGKMPELQNASAQAIGKIFPMVQAKISNDARLAQQQMLLQFKKQGVDQRNAEEKRRMTALQINSARGLLKDDPRFKKAIEQGMEFESVDSLLSEVEKGNETALSALGTKLARAMGEVGVLTDSDVIRYIAGQSWGRRLEKWYKGGMQGKMPKESLTEIKKNLKLLRGKLSGDVNKVYSNASSRMKTAFPDMDDITIKGLLGQPMIESEKPQEAPSWNDFEDIE